MDLNSPTKVVNTFDGEAQNMPNNYGAFGKVLSSYDNSRPDLGAQLALTRSYPRPQYRARKGGIWGNWNDLVLSSDFGYGEKHKVSNCNLAIENNIVYFADGDTLNRPVPTSDTTWFSVTVFAYNAGNLVQIAVPINLTTTVYIRKCYNSVWSDWIAK